MLRLDLLDDPALEAASSRGLLRRAHRDVAAGQARIIRQEADEVQVQTPDARVTLKAGGLRDAHCTCPSAEVCRHILAAIILLRRKTAGSSPESRADAVAEILAYSRAQLEKALGKVLLARAERTLPAPEAIRITPGGATCVVRIGGTTEVRYLAGLGIPGMVVNISGDTRLLRAQALLAVRRAHDSLPLEPPAPKPPKAVPQALSEELLGRARSLVLEWARAGLATAPQPLEERLFEGALAARAGGLFRLSTELRRLAEDVRRCRERDEELVPAASLRAAARTYALLEALRRDPQDLSLRGQARESFEPVAELSLIGCGLEIWKTPADARGATGYFYAPGERRWVSASLARAAGQDSSFVPEQAVGHALVWGTSLQQLAGAWVFLKNAAVSPGGRLSLGRDVKAHLQPLRLRRKDLTDWEGCFGDWRDLDAFIRARFAPTLRGSPRTEIAVLLPQRIGHPVFDEITQALVLPLLDHRDRVLHLTVPNLPHRQKRLAAVQELTQQRPPQAFFVTVQVAAEGLTLSPYALLLEEDSAPLSLDTRDPTAPRELPEAPSGPDLKESGPTAPTLSLRLLNESLAVLLGLCELGGQMQDPSLLHKLRTLAQRLESAGLTPAAQLLTAVIAAPDRDRAHAVLVAVHACSGLLELLRLPLA